MWTIALISLAVGLLIIGFMAYIAPKCNENQEPETLFDAVDFPERTALIAEDQPQYKTLPALIINSVEGEVITCWQLTRWQRYRLAITGKLWVSQLTFQQPLQPVLLTVEKHDLIRPNTAQ